jgi:hypothetical protein
MTAKGKIITLENTRQTSVGTDEKYSFRKLVNGRSLSPNDRLANTEPDERFLGVTFANWQQQNTTYNEDDYKRPARGNK